ncbi:LuxR C-terminal-related transcriptional regulator [Microbacterium sp. 179-I 3D4 NHS]|uniref:helix-turn-helix transcriptional regulator n=1 Tax=Microbacterium sp. 179-I 3D4 NHS TaxID=3142381 RepID=UPI00399FC078
METLLNDLRAADLPCAPHVVSRLLAELGAHGPTIREVAARLTRGQRQGLLALPAPLPVVPSIAAEYSGYAFSRRDRDLLLAIQTTLSDDLEPILAFDGRTGAEVAGGPVGRELSMHAGKVRLADPRLGIWIHGTTPAVDAARVHERLRAVFVDRGRTVDADWHRARAAMNGAPSAAPALIRAAGDLSEAGLADRALMIAREAAAHAKGAALEDARLAAGIAAVTAGYAMDATAWLGTLFPLGEERRRLLALPGLLCAQAHLQGTVPDVDPQSFRPTTADPELWHAWARAAALAAPLCAERGDRRGMRAWLSVLTDASSPAGVEAGLRDPAVALSWTLLGEVDGVDGRDGGPFGTLRAALRTALEGDVDGGIRLLAHGANLDGGSDALVKGCERSPLVRAYQAVAHALLLSWRGDIGPARDRLLRAALKLPVAMPFAGLGVVLARRLDLAVRGDLGPVSRALTAALPGPRRIDVLLDRGIRAFLAGDDAAAEAHVRLWGDVGAPRTLFGVPGLAEIAARHRHGEARPPAEPPETALARSLQERLALMSDHDGERRRDEVLIASRALRSPFLRGRIEAMIGMRAATRSEPASARTHLRRARSLFELAGADAWVRLVEQRLSRLEEGLSSTVADPLAACRAAWASRLTGRELEVAMAAVSGAGNREIAAALSVSVRTVEVHLSRVFAKVGVRSRVELTVLAHRVGLPS